MTPCLFYGEPTTNPKFCSRSCAASNNNKTHPKRKLGKTLCKNCKSPIRGGLTYCRVCFDRMKQDYTLKEVKYDKHHKSSAWALVRSRARALVKALPQICISCGYDKHVEVCHKIPIKHFPLETKISEVNHIGNLVLLCPNCHWEFDNGLLALSS